MFGCDGVKYKIFRFFSHWFLGVANADANAGAMLFSDDLYDGFNASMPSRSSIGFDFIRSNLEVAIVVNNNKIF